jgi:uncharacterized protein with HEPN domain
MDQEVKKLLYDIRESILSIEEYLKGTDDIKSYKANKMLRRAVEREVEIIGEALNRINKVDPGIDISGKRQIIGMRNRVIHAYDSVDDEIVWGAIKRHLPGLKKDVTELLQR